MLGIVPRRGQENKVGKREVCLTSEALRLLIRADPCREYTRAHQEF